MADELHESANTEAKPNKSQLRSALVIFAIAIVARIYLAFTTYGHRTLQWRGPNQALEWGIFLGLIFVASLTLGYVGRTTFNRTVGFLMAILGGGLGCAHVHSSGPIMGAFLSLPFAITVACHGERRVALGVIRMAVVVGLTAWLTALIYPSQAMLFLRYPNLPTWVILPLGIVFSMVWLISNRYLRPNRPRPIVRRLVGSMALIATVFAFVWWSHTYTRNAIRLELINRVMFRSNVYPAGRPNMHLFSRRALGEFVVDAIVPNSDKHPMPHDAVKCIELSPKVTDIRLVNCAELVDDDLVCLKHLRHLFHFELKNTGATEDALQHLPSSVGALSFHSKLTETGLQHLMDSKCYFDSLWLGQVEASDELLAALITHSKGLTRLQIKGSKLGPKTLAAISSSHSLSVLILSDCRFEDPTGLSIVSLKSLDLLNLTGTNVDVAGLVRGYTNRTWNLSQLILDRVPMNEEGCKLLGKVFIRDHISLANCGITDAQLTAFLKQRRLRGKLGLANNKLTDAGIKALAKTGMAMNAGRPGPSILGFYSLDISGNKGVTIVGLRSLRRVKLAELSVEETGVTKADVPEASKAALTVHFSPGLAGREKLKKKRNTSTTRKRVSQSTAQP